MHGIVAARVAFRGVIFSVVPEELGPEVLEQVKAHYADDPNVTVIVDRRRAGRPSGGPPTADETQVPRDAAAGAPRATIRRSTAATAGSSAA